MKLLNSDILCRSIVHPFIISIEVWLSLAIPYYEIVFHFEN